jgi:hypothetical protein
LATAYKGKGARALWATPSTVPPAIKMPTASQLTAIAGGAARAAGGGLTSIVVPVAPAGSHVL